jgi:integrase
VGHGVSGNALGQRADGFRRAWATAVLKAHEHQPRYTATGQLHAASRAVLDAIDLHFHDLRREAGSRCQACGVSLVTVRDWLGHTSIAQTSTYLASTLQTAHDAMARFDAGRGLQPVAGRAETGDDDQTPTAEATVN